MPDLEKLQIQALEVLQTVLAWFQSPLFWAQIGGIVLAWFVARTVTKILRSKVPLLHTEPAEGRLLFFRNIVYQIRDLVGSLVLVAMLAAIIPVL